jgi:TM2 domain-containing membrane protein YozV
VTTAPRKSPALAGFLSAIFVGLGQFYVGKWASGLMFIVCVLATGVLGVLFAPTDSFDPNYDTQVAVTLFSVVAWIVLVIWSVVDAVYSARRFNAERLLASPVAPSRAPAGPIPPSVDAPVGEGAAAASRDRRAIPPAALVLGVLVVALGASVVLLLASGGDDAPRTIVTETAPAPVTSTIPSAEAPAAISEAERRAFFDGALDELVRQGIPPVLRECALEFLARLSAEDIAAAIDDASIYQELSHEAGVRCAEEHPEAAARWFADQR